MAEMEFFNESLDPWVPRYRVWIYCKVWRDNVDCRLVMLAVL